MADAIFKILRCTCGKQEYHDTPEKDPPPCPRCGSPRSYSRSWYIKTYENGKRSIKAVSTQRKRAAQVLDHAEAMAVNRKFGLVNTSTAPLLSVAIETVYQERWRRNKDGEKSRRRAEMLMEIIGDRPLDEIGVDQFRQLHVAMTKRENKGATANRYLAALKTLLRRFDLSTRMIHMATESSRIKTYSPLEEQQILKCLDAMPFIGRRSGWADLPDLVRCLHDTGARLSEMLRLHERDVDFTSGAMRLVDTKSGKTRTIYMIGETRAILDRRKGKGKFFTIGIDQADNAWDVVRQELDIDDPDAVIHAWRHTSVTRMLEAGESPVTAQRWHGHSTITTTMRYVHYLDSHLQAAAERLNSQQKVNATAK